MRELDQANIKQEQNSIGQGQINKYFMSLTNEERIEIAKRGGKASAQKRKKRKTLQEDLLALLSQPIPKAYKKQEMIEGNTWQDGILYGALKSACKGNVRALEVIIALIGEKPIEQLIIQSKEKDGFDQALEQLFDRTDNKQ